MDLCILGKARLLEVLVEEKGLQHLIDAGCELLGNPLIVNNTNFKLLGYSKGLDLNDPIVGEAVKIGYMPHQKLTSKYYNSSPPQLKNIHNSVVYIKKLQDSHMARRLIGRIRLKDQDYGVLIIYEVNRPFEDSDMDLAKMLCDTLALEIQKNSFSHNMQIRLTNFEMLVRDLLEDRLIDDATIQNTMGVLNIKLGKNLYVLTVDLEASDIHRFPLNIILKKLEELFPLGFTIRYNSCIVILISSNEDIFEDKGPLDQLRVFLKKSNLLAGLSLCFSKLSETKIHFVQSVKALELGIRLKKKHPLFDYKNFLIYDLIQSSHAPSPTNRFCHPLALRILDYDAGHNTLYAKTLYAYLSKDKNNNFTASYLHVHTNTLTYRIGKMAALFRIDWSDSELLLALLISFKTLEYSGIMEPI